MNLGIIMRRCPRQVSAEECTSLLDLLQRQGFKLLLSSANRAYFEALGVDGSHATKAQAALLSQQAYAQGDLIPSDDWTEIVYLGRQITTRRQPGPPSLGRKVIKESHLELGCLYVDGASKLFEPLRVAVCEAIGVDANEPWLGLAWENQPFKDLVAKATSKRGEFSPDEITAAGVLADSGLRKLARAVKAAGSVLARDFPRVGGTDEESAKLESLGILNEQHVLICRKTSGMVLQLSALESLGQIDDKGISCPFCGRKPSEERVEQLLVPTDLCKQLLDHSRWMAALLISILGRMGIPVDSTLLEYQEGSEEVDAFLDVEGELVLIELKDKEFSMAQAYALAARIGLFRPKHVLIVTAEKVAPEVKEFFGRLKPEAALRYIEGLDGLEHELGQLANSLRAKSAAKILDNFKPLTMDAEITRLICAKMGIVLPEDKRDSLFGSVGHAWSTYMQLPQAQVDIDE